jgi:hypothetical protein
MHRCVPLLVLLLVAAGCGGGSGSGSSTSSDALLHPDRLTAEAPAQFDAVFDTTKGAFTVRVHRAWAPHGADRFYELVRNGYAYLEQNFPRLDAIKTATIAKG